jgi:hypothetical protein
MTHIILDSTPLGLLFTKPGQRQGDQCRSWLKRHVVAGRRFVVPEVVDYELRRELLRLGDAAAVAHLDQFIAAESDRYIALTTRAVRLAAEMWAQSRRHGIPTAHPHALDIDVILSAQVLARGYAPADFIVATSNVGHLSRFVPCAPWETV